MVSFLVVLAPAMSYSRALLISLDERQDRRQRCQVLLTEIAAKLQCQGRQGAMLVEVPGPAGPNDITMVKASMCRQPASSHNPL